MVHSSTHHFGQNAAAVPPLLQLHADQLVGVVIAEDAAPVLEFCEVGVWGINTMEVALDSWPWLVIGSLPGIWEFPGRG